MTFTVYKCDKIERGCVPENETKVQTVATFREAHDICYKLTVTDIFHTYAVGVDE